ncbi:beta-1,3-galactosyltransferase pvg3-like [Phragmites australis]|uniref:beta-1,3-galactosyltransferase pvg3-like n=1 Tax=Phragmites australis TaxID=29695 RepID=UPI002D78695D|nr:beta-1,3-galactosyltransferase pvg3-like [Phragmites australis]
MKPPSSTSCLLLAPLGLLLVVFVLPSLRPSRVGADGLGALCARRAGYDGWYTVKVAPSAPAESEPEFSLLVGVLTMPNRRERRDIVRLAYALQPRAVGARVDVRFVFCNVTDPVDAALVALEIKRHGDIVVLDCTENMNDGKTYAYLSSVPRLFAGNPYDYVMKTDDDTYLRVAALVDELRGKPREDVYLGYGYAMGGQPMPFMHGMGYVVSWDVASWVAKAGEILDRNDTAGPEDLMVGKWLNLAGRGRNRYDLKPRMYDLNWDMDNFRPDTVAAHMLKDNRRWAAAFRYFNVTAGFKPSNLYHLP